MTLVERLRQRLKHTSNAGRMYERPMTWDEADTLLADYDRLTAENERLREALDRIGTMTWKRPCDCERCDCRNVGDAVAVAAWDAEDAVRAEARRANVIPVLIDAWLTKEDCYQMIRNAGIELPRVYAQGYPNANCIGCVKATSSTYWNHVRQRHPEVFEKRAEQSRRLGAKLVRVANRRIYLDELDPSATGKPLKSMKAVECGIFCEEQP